MGGGGGSFDMGRPAEVRPVTFEQGVNLYSGSQSSLAGSLPSWIAWFSPSIEYELGSLVHFNETTQVYEHKVRKDLITQGEYDIMDDDGQDQYEAFAGSSTNPAQIVKRSLFDTEYEGNKLGSTAPIGDNLPLIMTYFNYSKDTIYVCTKDGAKLSVANFTSVVNRQAAGFWSLQELETAGWETGFDHSSAYDVSNSIAVDYRKIILNLADITASVVSVGEPKVIACNAILKPGNATEPSIYSWVDAKRRGFGTVENSPIFSNPNSDPIDLGVCELKLIPTDKISFGGGIVRTPISRGDMYVQEKAQYENETGQTFPAQDVSSETKFISAKVLPTFYDKDRPDNPYSALVANKKAGVVDPRYGEASTSLNAFLGSIYFHAFPQGGMIDTDYWAPGENYVEGEAVRYAYHQSDEGENNALNKVKKDCMWICRQAHTSTLTGGDKPPLMGQEADLAVTELLSNDYWQPYTRLINQPNSSLGNLHDLYKESGQIMQKPIEGEGANTVSWSGSSPNRPRARMSDLIGGSRLYGHLTMGPMGAKTKTRVDFRCGRRRRCSAGYLYLPPTGSNPGAGQDTTVYSLGAPSNAWYLKYLGGMDLWLFPNNFKKDHGGQIKYAVGFYDHISYNIETAWGSRRKSWFRRLVASIFGGRKSYDWSRTEKFSRTHFQSLTNVTQLDMDSNTSFDYSKSAGWTTGDAYSEGDVVKSDNKFYRSLVNSNQGNTPVSSPNKWEDIVDTDALQENDILRFSFRYLTGFCDQKDLEGKLAASGVPNGHYYVNGYYEVVIQDLNSGNVLKPSFEYLQLMSIPQNNAEDSFGRTWSPVARGTYDYQLWEEYMNASDAVASKFTWTNTSTGSANEIQSKLASVRTSPSETKDLKLIATRNWYNWLILGSSAPKANALNAIQYYDPLLIKSMDVPESVFKSLCGMVHTGFRNMDFSQIQDSAPKDDGSGNLVGDLDYSLPAAFQELASGVTLPPSIELDTGNNLGAFTTSKDINLMPERFISNLKANSVDLSALQNKIYQPGEVVKYQNKFYYIKEVITGQNLKGEIDG